MKIPRCCTALLVLLVSDFAIAAHPGVDPTFGSYAFADVPASALGLTATSRMDIATVTRAAADAGYSYVFASNYQNYALARLGPDGQVDPAFGSSGAIEGTFPTAGTAPMAMGLTANARPLIAAGGADYFATVLQLRRVTNTGGPDTSFGANGYASITFPVVVTDNGIVPVAPTRVVARNGGGAYVIMARSAVVAITEQGSVDTSFASGGYFIGSSTVIDQTSFQDIVLAVSPNGGVYILRETLSGPRVLRFLANGTIDALYGLTLPSSLPWNAADSYLDGAENLYITFTTSGVRSDSGLSIYKLDADSRLDTLFGTNGMVFIEGMNGAFPYDPAYRLTDVGGDGALLLVARINSQYYTPPLAIKLLDRAGKPVATFGGKGVTRLEQTPMDTRDFYGTNARFDESGRVIALGIGSTRKEAIRAVRLNRAFVHVATLTDAKTSENSAGTATPRTTFQYGDNIRADAVLDGDSGQPVGSMRFDAGPLSCSEPVFPTTFPPRAGCAVLADRLAELPWTLTFLGDEIYGAVQVGGPQIRIDKRKLSPYLASFDQATAVADYAQATVRWLNPLPQLSLAAPTGVTQFSFGDATCEAPLDYFVGGACRLIVRQVGTLPLTARYLADPYYTSDVSTLGTIEIRPAVKSVSVNLASGTAQLTVSAADVNCGLKTWYSYDPSAYLGTLPRLGALTAAKMGAITFTTVPGCPPNAALAVTVTYPFDVVPEAELWSYVATSGSGTPTWARLPAMVSGRTVSTTIVEGSAFDFSTETPGAIGAGFVLYNAAGTSSPQPGQLSSVSAFAFGEQPVGAAGVPATVTLTNIGGVPVTIASVLSSNPGEFPLSGVACGVIDSGGTCLIHVTFLPASAGPRAGAILITSNAVGSPNTIAVTGLGVASTGISRLIEYHHAAFDHYFVTSIIDEIAKLDAGVFAGWKRTGLEISANALGSQPATVCRFFSAVFAPKSSHFYTASASECDAVKRNSNWEFEGSVFNIEVPTTNGACTSGTVPVYRLYNNGQGGAPNHRYTTSLTVRNQMLALGWVPEGYGSEAVMMCAPVDR